jgi:hypothetical protein
MMTPTGPASNATGKEAHRALLCYIEWIKSLARTQWNSSEQKEVDEARRYMNEHIAEVTGTFKSKGLKVSII